MSPDVTPLNDPTAHPNGLTAVLSRHQKSWMPAQNTNPTQIGQRQSDWLFGGFATDGICSRAVTSLNNTIIPSQQQTLHYIPDPDLHRTIIQTEDTHTHAHPIERSPCTPTSPARYPSSVLRLRSQAVVRYLQP